MLRASWGFQKWSTSGEQGLGVQKIIYSDSLCVSFSWAPLNVRGKSNQISQPVLMSEWA